MLRNAPKRRDGAECNSDDRGEEHRVEGELARRGDELPEVVRDGGVRQRRLPEIAVHEVVEIDGVANRQRPIEPVGLADRIDGAESLEQRSAPSWRSSSPTT